MTIVRNVIPNPQHDGTGGWLAGSGTLSSWPMTASWPAANGATANLVTASGGLTTLSMPTLGDAPSRFPISPGMTAGWRTWIALDTGIQARAGVVFYDAAGAAIGGTIYGEFVSAVFYAGAEATVTAVAPAGAASVRFQAVATNIGGGTIAAGKRMWVDRSAGYTDTAENVAAALALGYRDGSSPGWAWEGTPRASASRGQLEPYAPEARLTIEGIAGFELVGYIDQLAGFELEAEGRSVVHRSAVPEAAFPVSVSHRPAGSDTGSMVARFTTETGEGAPGERALKLYNALKRGGHYGLGLEVYLPGWSGFTFAQVGAIRVAREPGVSDRWTVEFGIDTLAVGDYL